VQSRSPEIIFAYLKRILSVAQQPVGDPSQIGGQSGGRFLSLDITREHWQTALHRDLPLRSFVGELSVAMTFAALFLLQAFVIVSAPVVLLRVSGLKGLMPLVVMQIAVGIALGPSVFGRVAPDYFHMFVSPETLSSLTGLATVAVVIFGLVSGLHLDPGVFNGNDRTFWPIAIGNVLVPMALGLLAGYAILARHPDELLPGVSPVEFIAAIGICVTMKALPVLGAILGEMNLFGTRIGNLALGVAGVIDIILWMTLAVLLTAAAAGQSGGAHGLPPIYLATSAPLYLFLMVRVVRPVLGSMLAARIPVQVKDRMLVREVNARALVVVGAATMASALATELMGLHYIIGAFLIGVIMPVHLRQPIIDRLQVMTVALLMPFFFAVTGMRTLIDLGSPALLEVFTITTGVTAIGVIGGTAAAARLFGETWSFGLGLGSLLQAKGLTELIVLTILLDAGIVSPTIFAAMILMALVCTALAMPLARLILGKAGDRLPIAEPL
jgi:Kef-type K+ transport system membrane component KefB